MSEKPQTLYLIDSHALLYRAYHAIRPGSMLALDRRTPTNAVFGFAGELRKLRSRYKPDFMAAVFDPQGTVNRVARYDEYAAKLGPAFSGYKTHRDAVPDDLRPQIEIALELCAAYGIPSYMIEGFEADDVIATLAVIANKNGIKTVVVSGDKDLMQLIGPGIEMYDPLKDIVFDADTVLALKGVTPAQIVDWLGFQGDPVDNIPGVAGVGGQTAVRLLQEHGTMDAALEHYRRKFAAQEEEILAFVAAHEAEALKENKEERKPVKPPKGVKVVDAYLFAQHERARACRELARLDLDVPLKFELEAMRLNPPQAERLAPLLKRLDFKTFLRDLDPQQVAAYENAQTDLLNSLAAAEPAEGGPAATQGQSGPSEPDTKIRRVETDVEFSKTFLPELRKQNSFTLDLAAPGVHPRASEIYGLGFSWKDGEAWYLPFRGELGAPTLSEKDTFAQLKPILEDAKISKFGHGIKPALNLLRNHGIRVKGVAFDSLLAGWLLEPSAARLTVDELGLNYLNLRDSLTDRQAGARKKKAGDTFPGEECARRSGLNADLCWRLSHALAPRIREAGLQPLLATVEIPLIDVLADMEWTGVRVDAEFLRAMSVKLEKQLAEQEEAIYAGAGEKFNIGSPKQLATILFEKLGLDSKATTATGQASTSEEVLLALGKSHELPRRILDYRQASKLKSTYVDALPQMITTSTQRIHATFNQTGAETGRLSSNDPNLQNIPIRGDLGRTIRAAFKPAQAGWKILSADYSQIELRILAHYSEDKNLLAAFERGTDIHTAVAASLNGISEMNVTREQRSQAKAVNFGIIYGQTAFGLAAVLGIGRRQAQTIIETYFEQHPGVRKCIDEIVIVARDQGFVTTVLGRRRFIPQLRASDRGARALGERLAVNTVFQGSAADLLKKAMIEIHEELCRGYKAKLLMTIHDELLFETPAEEAQELQKLVKSRMENALQLKVPLVVETGIGDDWLAAK